MFAMLSAFFKQPETDDDVRRVQLPRPRDQSKLAIVVKNVFSSEECRAMIAETEKKGYDQALVNTGGGRQELKTDYRRSSRCILDSVEQASEIWKRIKEHIPVTWNFRGEQWNVVGLNERLRYLRYSPGDFFSPHFDGCYKRENGEQSFITLMLYLNEDFEGGATTFLDIDSKAMSKIQPAAGSVLIFQHDIYHSGLEVRKGVKYAIRTDVMYKITTN
jgi:predicted 2-oxoglutarate/Fe(II)-dependent dioxygenase YbiX